MAQTDNKNARKTSPWGERLFQAAVAMVATAIGFWGGLYASDRGDLKKQAAQISQIVRVIHAATKVDIDTYSLSADCFKGLIEARKFSAEPYLFLLSPIPHPELLYGSEIGCLDPEVIAAIEKYRQQLRTCENYRQTFVRELSTSDSENRPITLFFYYSSIEVAISDAENILAALHNKYPQLSPQHLGSGRSILARQLAKIVEEESGKAPVKMKSQVSISIIGETTNQPQ